MRRQLVPILAQFLDHASHLPVLLAVTLQVGKYRETR